MDCSLFPVAAARRTTRNDVFPLTGAVPQSEEACKKDGWTNFTTPRSFRNQGECVAFVEANARAGR